MSTLLICGRCIVQGRTSFTPIHGRILFFRLGGEKISLQFYIFTLPTVLLYASQNVNARSESSEYSKTFIINPERNINFHFNEGEFRLRSGHGIIDVLFLVVQLNGFRSGEFREIFRCIKMDEPDEAFARKLFVTDD